MSIVLSIALGINQGGASTTQFTPGEPNTHYIFDTGKSSGFNLFVSTIIT